jgi:hypothetical protein
MYDFHRSVGGFIGSKDPADKRLNCAAVELIHARPLGRRDRHSAVFEARENPAGGRLLRQFARFSV